MSELKAKIEEYVQNQLSGFAIPEVRGPKVIHDSVLGSNVFKAYEIAVLDLPLLQRLRRVSQVDLVPLVFPSGNHNRFEHTLGVAVIAEKLVKALWEKINTGKDEAKEPYNKINIDYDYVYRHARMAAIMHDCGHGPFSHMSEQVYENYPDMQQELENNPILKKCQPKAHEALSYLIVTSTAFKGFFASIQDRYKVNINLDLVGEMIIGYIRDPKQAFLIEIINGAFDADKLDYIQRDSHFTGIKMVLDMPRLFHTIDLIEDDCGAIRLSVDISGVAPLEQIIFNKMMLLSTVYSHHKVRAAECIFKSLIAEIQHQNYEIYGLKFKSSSDFLYLTDDDIYSLAKHDAYGKVAKYARELRTRSLPKRSLLISAKTSKQGASKTLNEIMGYRKLPKMIQSIRESISERTGNVVSPCDIWIDIPGEPKFKEAISWPIKSYGNKGGYVTFDKVLPIDSWINAFMENKWQAYIFTKPEYRKIVNKAAISVFSEVFELGFEEAATDLCKIDENGCSV